MGYTMVWEPVDAEPLTGLVHFRVPTEKETLAEADYHPMQPYMEFREEDFPGLYDLVSGSVTPTVTIDGTVYIAKSGERLSDGKTVKAYLEIV